MKHVKKKQKRSVAIIPRSESDRLILKQSFIVSKYVGSFLHLLLRRLSGMKLFFLSVLSERARIFSFIGFVAVLGVLVSLGILYAPPLTFYNDDDPAVWDHSLGKSKHMLILFGDFSSVTSKEYYELFLATAKKEEFHGDVEFVYKNTVVDSSSSIHIELAQAVGCVELQGDEFFWEISRQIYSKHYLFASTTLSSSTYRLDGSFVSVALERLIRGLQDFSFEDYETCLKNKKFEEFLAKDLQELNRVKFNELPVSFIDGKVVESVEQAKQMIASFEKGLVGEEEE